jgi:hypothetical protein
VTKKRMAKAEAHGGRREGSGKPSWFRGKSSSADEPQYRNIPDPWSIRLTPKGAEIGNAALARLNASKKDDEPEISRNVLVDMLLRLFGKSVNITQLRVLKDK